MLVNLAADHQKAWANNNNRKSNINSRRNRKATVATPKKHLPPTTKSNLPMTQPSRNQGTRCSKLPSRWKRWNRPTSLWNLCSRTDRCLGWWLRCMISWNSGICRAGSRRWGSWCKTDKMGRQSITTTITTSHLCTILTHNSQITRAYYPPNKCITPTKFSLTMSPWTKYLKIRKPQACTCSLTPTVPAGEAGLPKTRKRRSTLNCLSRQCSPCSPCSKCSPKPNNRNKKPWPRFSSTAATV